MNISLFTVLMTILWSSVLIIFFYFLRTKLFIYEVCSLSGIIAIYSLVALRLLLPIELPWTQIIYGGRLANALQTIMQYKAVTFNNNSFTVVSILAIIWITVAIVGVGKTIIRFCKISIALNNLSGSRVNNLRASGKNISVIKTDFVNSPCAAGIINKYILIPNRTYSEEEMDYILAHEMAHHENKDILIKLCVQLLCAFYWWNPIVYLLKKDLNQILEIRCDQAVTRRLNKAQTVAYLETVMKEFKNNVSTTFKSSDYVLEMASSKNSGIVERFNFVAMEQPHTSVLKRILLIICVLGIYLSSYLFVVQSYFDAPEEAEKGVIYYDATNSFIEKRSNGIYYMITPNMEFELDESELEFYTANGFCIKE